MKVCLIVSDLSYPPREGLHQQTILLVSELMKIATKFTLAGYCKDLEALNLEALQRDYGITFSIPPEPSNHSSLLQGVINWISPRRRGALRKLIHESTFDVLHLEGAAAAGLHRRETSKKTVISFIDPGSRRQFRLGLSEPSKAATYRRYVAGMIYMFLELVLRFGTPIWHVVSPSDANYLRRLYLHPAVISIPVIIPMPAKPEKAVASRITGKQDPSMRILIFSDLRQSHCLRDFYELVDRSLTGLDLHCRTEILVLGRIDQPADYSAVPSRPKMKFIRWADDYQAVVCDSDIVILPDQIGTGLKNRTIQSMSLGIPTAGFASAYEGIPVINGAHGLIAADHEDLRLKLSQIMADPVQQSQIGEAGKGLVYEKFSASTIGESWRLLYKRLSPNDQCWIGEASPTAGASRAYSRMRYH